MARVLLALVMLSRAGVAFAYRPFVSTDAAVAAPGEIEVEFGCIGFRRRHGDDTIVAPTTIANLGLAENLELVAETKAAHDLTAHHGRSQAEDTAVSLKWIAHEGALQERGPSPSLAVELSLLVPTARDERQVGAEVTGIASGTAFGWTYHLNGGGLVDATHGEPGLTWGVILEHPVRGSLRAVAEVNGEAVRSAPDDNSTLVGAIWEVGALGFLHDVALDVGVRRGISRGADDWGGTAGVTIAAPW